jgi:serine/threonine-protein kinase
VIAFRCMTGRLPFEGEAIGDLLVKICTSPLPVPSQWAPGLPPGFDDWFVRALNREPAGRFNSAPELAEALLIACGMATPGSRQPAPTPSTGSHAAAVSAPYPQQSWGQPTPAGGSGSYPGQSAANPAGMTGAAFTQTPVAGVPTSSKGPIVLAVLAGLLVLGGGAVLAATLLKPEPPPTEPATTPSVSVEATTAETAAQPSTPAPVPEVVPAAPVPSASVAAASSAKPPATTSKPVSERTRPTVRPRLPSGGAVATKTKPETTKPKPEEKSKPTPPKPAGIDVGY